LNQEKKYFTDLGENIVEHSDSLWGQQLFPYIRVDQKASIQGRIYEADSMSISFEEVITIKEKTKKKKKIIPTLKNLNFSFNVKPES